MEEKWISSLSNLRKVESTPPVTNAKFGFVTATAVAFGENPLRRKKHLIAVPQAKVPVFGSP
jgi:hypothetical protein